ncbi:hypothetical protein [Leptospira phage LE4]|uniref:Uncharacterized protein n=1 Tax=Leptospira phage LE4 TaxID=2041383 RepID=A0A343LEA6_9CAUD|nr:hypothetical protein HWB34_gp03 [Leptospira phage LE4]ATN95016.1 hypothetical protein [Leptospira phage LE4]
MNQSIYTERENILPHHAEWLDGCGAVWWINRVRFSLRHDISEVSFIAFCVSDNTFLTSYDESYTHIPTGTEFCERVAEILGLPKPTFEVDISKKETTTDHIPDIGEKVEPIKGMAIEVSRLSEEDKKTIEQFSGDSDIWSEKQWTYILYDTEGFNLCKINAECLEGLDITESPTEFLEYVAQQTGKEYKPMNNHQAVTSGTNDEVNNTPRIGGVVNERFLDMFDSPTYPHKTYRILDSLDGIPFDKRIPLSEWIPPFGVEVLWINEKLGHRFFSELDKITPYGIIVSPGGVRVEDGHWMRIV